VGGLPAKLDFQISVNHGGCGCRVGELGADDDHGELRAACCFHHVKIAVAISAIERFYRDSDQKITMPCVATTLSLCSVTYAVHFMHWMRHVKGEGRLNQAPLTVRLRKHRKSDEQNANEDCPFHFDSQNFQ
jgi:hypothetical protein